MAEVTLKGGSPDKPYQALFAVLQVNYEDLRKQPPSFLSAILDGYGIDGALKKENDGADDSVVNHLPENVRAICWEFPSLMIFAAIEQGIAT